MTHTVERATGDKGQGPELGTTLSVYEAQKRLYCSEETKPVVGRGRACRALETKSDV